MPQQELNKKRNMTIGGIYLALALTSALFLVTIGDRNNVFNFLESLSFSFTIIFGIIGGVYLLF